MSRTWLDMAFAAGARSEQEADDLLWCGSAFPFAPPRIVWLQIRHVVRHRICFDNPGAMCGWTRRVRRAHGR